MFKIQRKFVESCLLILLLLTLFLLNSLSATAKESDAHTDAVRWGTRGCWRIDGKGGIDTVRNVGQQELRSDLTVARAGPIPSLK